MSETLMRKHNHFPYANPNAANPEILANDFFQFYQSPRRNQTFHRDVETKIWPFEASLMGQSIIYISQSADKQNAFEIVMEAITRLFDFFKNKDRFVRDLKREVARLDLLQRETGR